MDSDDMKEVVIAMAGNHPGGITRGIVVGLADSILSQFCKEGPELVKEIYPDAREETAQALCRSYAQRMRKALHEDVEGG